MYCFETLNVPLLELHISSGQRLKSRFCHGFDHGIFPKRLGSPAWEITIRIEEYSTKTMGDPLDILNGVLGVLKVFETGPQKISHCCGIPIFPKPPKVSAFFGSKSDKRAADQIFILTRAY